MPAPPESTPAPARFIENLKPAETEHAAEEEGISAEEAARLGYELSAERREPTTEEGEEELVEKYVLNVEWRGDDYGKRKGYYRDAYLAGLREGRRLGQIRGEANAQCYQDTCENQVAEISILKHQLAAAQAEVAELKEEKEQKRKDRADGWWLDLNLEELREEFACLEELECENQAAVAELGAQCLEKSTDGIWTLGNMLHDERAKVSRLEEDLGKCGVEMEKDRLEIERLRKENARISEYANQTTENLLATAYANERFREELARLREMVKVAVDALENIAPHNMKYSGSCDNQRASCWEKEARRLAEAAREALARLRSGKDRAGKLPKGYPGETEEGEENRHEARTKAASELANAEDSAEHSFVRGAAWADATSRDYRNWIQSQKQLSELRKQYHDAIMDHARERDAVSAQLVVAREENALLLNAVQCAKLFNTELRKSVALKDPHYSGSCMLQNAIDKALARLRSGKDGGKKDG